MAGASDWLIDKIVADLFQTPNLWLALMTVRPLSDGTGGTEVVGGSYARQPIDFTDPDDAGVAVSNAVLTYVGMPACTVVAGALFTAVTGGNFYGANNWSVARTITAGYSYVVSAGDVTVQVR